MYSICVGSLYTVQYMPGEERGGTAFGCLWRRPRVVGGGGLPERRETRGERVGIVLRLRRTGRRRRTRHCEKAITAAGRRLVRVVVARSQFPP